MRCSEPSPPAAPWPEGDTGPWFGGHDGTHCSLEGGRIGEQGHAGVRVCEDMSVLKFQGRPGSCPDADGSCEASIFPGTPAFWASPPILAFKVTVKHDSDPLWISRALRGDQAGPPLVVFHCPRRPYPGRQGPPGGQAATQFPQNSDDNHTRLQATGSSLGGIHTGGQWDSETNCGW